MQRSLLISALAAIATLAAATGGGGVTSGAHVFVLGFSNYELLASAYGGFGYGANSRGTRIGGFGIAITDQVDDSAVGAKKLVGGFGGNLAGQELVLGPVTLAITAWTGIGGIAAAGIPGSGGYFALFEQLDLEVGVRLVWGDFR
jgi:hypothetical protein